MADPFEVRMRFTSQLQHLNASVNSAQKAANYALKYRDMDEDLHSCILEQLERNNMNNRANIMYFIEHLCDVAQRENHLEFVRMMQRDILRVIDAVAPSDGSGAANVKVVRRVLAALQQKQVLMPETVVELEDCLKERDIAVAHPALSSPPNGSSSGVGANTPRANGGIRLDKRQIEQRIEEDRERHKRSREVIWQVPGEGDAEFEKMWEETSDIGEDDYIAAHEDAEERRQAVEFGTGF
ncbi:CTD kinase subunit gamma [Saccharata proteae CBS 121410]|uniref:CTD kinase subunit gamma n=1 Tax=Saccharata proteae CBS 121410 TaxID=1314787 RepID=A0A9P4HUR8_9PEZI|nr:CTD kinase subunit gamma [Saccharata proteae CBS 121410]